MLTLASSASATWPNIKLWDSEGSCVAKHNLDPTLKPVDPEGITGGGVCLGPKASFALAAATHGKVLSFGPGPSFKPVGKGVIEGAAFFTPVRVNDKALVAGASSEGLVLIDPATVKVRCRPYAPQHPPTLHPPGWW